MDYKVNFLPRRAARPCNNPLQKAKFFAYYSDHSSGVIYIMAITSVNALAYNMVHSLMIKRTSAVTTTVLGEVKIVGLLVLSALLLGERFGARKQTN